MSCPRISHHFFVCTNERSADNPLPSCKARGGQEVFTAFQSEFARRRYPAGIKVTATLCLTPCQYGPTVVVYPAGIWYAGVTPEDVPEIAAAHLDNATIVERLLLPTSVRLW